MHPSRADIPAHSTKAGTDRKIIPGDKPVEAGATPHRRDPRYVEQRAELSDWIQVKLVRQFGAPIQLSGVLMDLTPRAVKVGFPDESIPCESFSVGARLLVTFRFRNLTATTATATISRVDRMENGLSLVLFFDFLRESDRASLLEICESSQTREVPLSPGIPRAGISS